MKQIMILMIISSSISAQVEDCGDRMLVSAIEDATYSLARGSLDAEGWKFAGVYSYESAGPVESINIGVQTTESPSVDTMYICYPDIIRPTAVQYKGRTEYMYPWHFDVFDKELSRDQMAAIPVPMIESGCPDTVWTGFELWYSDAGDARYRRRGAIYRYEVKRDTIADIVEKVIIKKQCQELKAGSTYRVKSDQNIMIKNGHCDGRVNQKDQLVLERGEILRYKGCQVDGNVITFNKGENFKIIFKKGKTRLTKVKSGGVLSIISNVSWE